MSEEDYTVIHVMRHGEVDNPEGVLYERLPGYHLSPLGQKMAQRVARHLQDEGAPIKLVVTSPLERAKESGAPTAQTFGVELETDPRLIEAANSFRGMQVNKHRLQLAHPRYWKRYVNPLQPSWGEPYAQQAQRMVEAIRSVLHRVRGTDALVVSHQLPIWCLRSHLMGWNYAHLPWRRECALASLTTLVFEGTTLAQVNYCEPAAELLEKARDMTPGSSSAITKF